MANNADEKRSALRKFRNYYLACRNKGEVIHGLGSTSRWRAFKFACRMTWWGIAEVERRG